MELIVTTLVSFDDLQALLLQYPGHRCSIRLIKGSKLKTWLGRLKGRLYPNVRNIINHNKALFLSFDVLVTPHANLDAVFKLDKNRKIKYVCTFHGAGDGDIGFDKRFASYDLLLTSGIDVNERLKAEGVVHEKNTSRIIGYPKYEVIKPCPVGPFSNDKLVFVYNPHYSKGVSSWAVFGLQVLDFFVDHPQYNLVFAPHIKVFDGHSVMELNQYGQYENIVIDVSSSKLMDASYTSVAHVYIGDVSSQVYEFLYFALKPVIFLDVANNQSWRSQPSFQMWKTGTVVNDMADFPRVVADVQRTHNEFIAVQRGLLARKFSQTDTVPGQRGAQAIIDFIK
ncbi:MAG: hypothetical protein RPT25_15140 [Cycloclasticus sp.]